MMPDLHQGVIALRDCGVILADTWHPVYSQLVRAELAVRRPLHSPNGRKSTFRLSADARRYLARRGEL